MDLISTIIHLYCFCFFLRILFHDPSEMYFNNILNFARKITDPVINFLKQNKIFNITINPWLPIMLLLGFKAWLLRNDIDPVLAANFNTAFLDSVLKFFSFLFKTCLLFFWLVHSSYRYSFYDEIFNIMALICNKILNLIPLNKKISTRNNPLKAFLVIILIFFICFTIINLGIIYISKIETYNFFRTVSVLPLNTIFIAIIDMLSLLPLLILVRIVVSWFMAPMSRMLAILHAATEPVLEPFRKLNIVIGMIDLSPIIALFAVQVVIQILVGILKNLN